MSARIHVLSAAVANQIAAGEVIERPASVVKELLENAMDSGATNITIDIGFGGLNYIKVSDNGSGIVAEDLPLAVAAHATSKINQLEDLYRLSSMGFRGEALASIASISRLSLISKPFEQSHGMQLLMEGTDFTLSPFARSQGTTVEVRDLFFNAPVRKKFLKTPLQEYKAIELIVKRFALSAPAISLTLYHNTKQMLLLKPADTEPMLHLRIQKLLGKQFFEQAIYLDVTSAAMRLYGWVSGLLYQRSQNDKQWIYVNQRMVKDKLLNHALKQAYEARLHPGRHPACILYLTLPADEVDVNVHPTKHEVRFQQSRLVHDLFSSQIAQSLSLSSTSSQSTREGGIVFRETSQSNYFAESFSTSSPSAWFEVNHQFVIIRLNHDAYLVDVRLLYLHKMKHALTHQTLPLNPRPLLVPVQQLIDKKTYQVLEEMQSILAQVGVEFSFSSFSHVLVRTIPVDVPLLNIPLFFSCISSGVCNQAAVIDCLINSQVINVQAINFEEQTMLVDYLSSNIDTLRDCCRRLDEDSCRYFFHE